MAIIDLQRRITEAGRIRTGQQVPAGGGHTRPEKLETFRFTSADKRRIEQIATLYGGKVEPWTAPAGAQWQVITERSEIDIIVPPADLGFSQFYELWSAGGCQRRCDGVTESISEAPCLCDPEARECDVHTRLSVLLRDIPGLGVWRLDTQGWYAAQELQGAVEVIAIAAGHGALLPARLRLDQRMVKRPDKNGKVVTRRFGVPVIDIEVTPGQLLPGGQGVPLQVAAGEPQRPAPLTPVPQLAAGPSIAEQSQPPAPRPPRANAATELPASGRRRAERGASSRPPLPGPPPAADEPIGSPQSEPDRHAAAGVQSEPERPAPPAGAPAASQEPGPGLSARALAGLCVSARKSKTQVADAIARLGRERPALDQLSPAITAMTDQVRGLLADELGLEWRSAA